MLIKLWMFVGVGALLPLLAVLFVAWAVVVIGMGLGWIQIMILVVWSLVMGKTVEDYDLDAIFELWMLLVLEVLDD